MEMEQPVVRKLTARCYFSLSMITIVAGAVNTGDVWYYSPADSSQLEIIIWLQVCDIINFVSQ